MEVNPYRKVATPLVTLEFPNTSQNPNGSLLRLQASSAVPFPEPDQSIVFIYDLF
jgi:hypothetical protein